MTSKQYGALLKIKKPVLIEVYNFDKNQVIKYRILYPNGKCEYTTISGMEKFKRSCFCTKNLKETVEQMIIWDGFKRKIKTKELA